MHADLAARLAADSDLSLEFGHVGGRFLVSLFDAAASLTEPAATGAGPTPEAAEDDLLAQLNRA